jgi:hypothetical protein
VSNPRGWRFYCGRCPHTWRNVHLEHCGHCHRDFASAGVYNGHRVNGKCVHPAELTPPMECRPRPMQSGEGPLWGWTWSDRQERADRQER